MENLLDFVKDHEWAFPPEIRMEVKKQTTKTVAAFARLHSWVFPERQRITLLELTQKANLPPPDFPEPEKPEAGDEGE